MRAFGLGERGGDFGAIEELELPQPEVRPRDLLVRVEACAMNPIDTKLRKLNQPPGGFPKVLGFDGAGVVRALGADASSFSVGDRVFFAGSHIRNGSNADLVAVDERVVGRAPARVPPRVAASAPLCVLTAWEGLEQLGLDPSMPGSAKGKRLLVIPGAGGVGSYTIQFARRLGMEVIATASRPDSQSACRALGADHVVDHSKPLLPQLQVLGIGELDYIYDAVSFESYAPQFLSIIKPFGKIVTITTIGKADLDAFKSKAVSICWELMFVRPAFETEDIAHQGDILNAVAQLIDDDGLQLPIWKILPWSLDSLRLAHELQESGKAIGKIVIARDAE